MNTPQGALARAVAGLAACWLAGCSGYGGGNGQPASLTISVAPTSISLGQSAVITWNSNGSRCTASGAWSGPRAASGNETVTPAQAGTHTYSMTCTGGGYGESNEGSTTLTVTSMLSAGLWIGEGCCVGSGGFAVAGLTNPAGDYRFLLLDTHYVGEAGKPPVAFATHDDQLAGRRQADTLAFQLLDIAPRDAILQLIDSTGAARGRAAGKYAVPYDDSFERPAGRAALPGSYTTSLGTGYTLTLTVDDAGRIIGNDTNGCRLVGQLSARQAAASHYDAALEVSGCGDSDGRYDGQAALVLDHVGRATEMLLSTSNSTSAIGWRLRR